MTSRNTANNGAQWITLPEVKKSASIVAGYALKFDVSSSHVAAIEVAADQQYELYLAGKIIGRGSESGTPGCWFFDRYQLKLSPGSHILAAMVWSWSGRHGAMAQMEVFHGFHLSSSRKPTRTLLGTGLAPWRAKLLRGIDFTRHEILPNGWTGVPPSQTLEAKRFPWSWAIGDGNQWKSPEIVSNEGGSRNKENQKRHQLSPSRLPPPLSAPVSLGSVVFVSEQIGKIGPLRKQDDRKKEHAIFDALITGEEIVLPAGTKRKVLFDLGNYYCAYPSVTTSGGKAGRIRLTWAEALFDGETSMEKGNRNVIWEKYMRGIWDEFRPDGDTARNFTPLTWRAGRYLELTIESGIEPMKLGLKLQETRFDFLMRGGFSSDSDRVNEILPISRRSLEMSSHDNFVDCPFYERLLYSGDGRLEALVAYAISGDDLLARKAIQLFASSAEANGLCMSRWPSREIQYIPTFALWWIGMVYDFSMWRDDRSFVRSVLPAVRSTLEYFLSRLDRRGIYTEKEAVWNFVDWVPEWKEHPNGGVPPSEGNVNMLVNGILAYTLLLAAKLESYAGNSSYAERYASTATTLGHTLHEIFWDPKTRLYKDDRSGNWFSEHTQIMAILGGLVPSEERGALLHTMIGQRKIVRTSLFFTHYLFEACFLAGREDIFFKRLGQWNGFIKSGFTTVPENFANTRSDCHGWGSHPLYHLTANVGGIRPSSPGFGKVLVAPQLGPLQEVEAHCPHPLGMIHTTCHLKGDRIMAKIELPQGLSGKFVYGRHNVNLESGIQTLRLSLSANFKSLSEKEERNTKSFFKA